MARYIFPILLLVPQAYLFFRFRRWQESLQKLPRPVYVGIVGLFVLFNAALVSTMFLRVFRSEYPSWFISWVVYPFLMWHVSTFIIAVVLLAGAIIRLPFKAVWLALRKLGPTKQRAAALAAHPGIVQFDQKRRLFLRRSMYGLTAASFGGTAFGMILGKGECEINEQNIRIPDLPKEWDGFSIGLVTDIHSSMYMLKRDMDEYVRRLNDLGADVIAVGGDLVNGSVDEIYPFAESFSKLNAPMGAFGVLGNHDFYARDVERIVKMSNDAGIRMLRNEGVVLHRHGSALALLGIDDAGTAATAEQGMRKALKDAPDHTPRILLSHRPYFFKQAASLGVDLMLSGHTHGGQLVFGRFGDKAFTPAALASAYVWGHYRENASQMYISRGIGTVAVPVRINCPPELTRIVLRRA